MTQDFSTLAAFRFGYGFRANEPKITSTNQLLEQVLTGSQTRCLFPEYGLEQQLGEAMDLATQYKDASKAMNGDAGDRRAIRKFVNRSRVLNLIRDSHLRVIQSIESPFGFHERLAAFWMSHFAVSTRKTVTMPTLVPLLELEAIRPNLGGSFRTLLKAAVLHPAMITYLDQNKSVGPNSQRGLLKKRGLNENLGRELLELHTLGVSGGYTQHDVTSAAKVLTGLQVADLHLSVIYRVAIAEPGEQIVLGKTYGGPARSVEDVYKLLDDLADNEKTQAHICRKLVTHFIADHPPADIVDAMTHAWRATDGDLLAVYRAMLEHPLSWEKPGQKVRQPFDLIVAGLRAVNLPDARLREIHASPESGEQTGMQMDIANPVSAKALKRPKDNPLTVGAIAALGQPIWRPSSPKGWNDDTASWISGLLLARRIKWSLAVGNRHSGNERPTDFAQRVLGDAMRPDTERLVSRAPSKQLAFAMVLASPEFNRR